MTTYNDWLDGNAPDTHALRELLNELGETESEIKAHERNKEELRKRIDRVVSQMGGRAQIDGLATVSIVGSGERVSYDTKTIDAVLEHIGQAISTGEFIDPYTGAVIGDETCEVVLSAIRRGLSEARKVTSVKASLRIELERGRK